MSNRNLIYFDYGYALTVHKSQGSEWDAVMLMAEKMGKQTPEEYRRWLYTGVTRASQQLILVT
jgi:exodeoxyribonuclease-5